MQKLMRKVALLAVVVPMAALAQAPAAEPAVELAVELAAAPIAVPELAPRNLSADYLAQAVTLAVTNHPSVQARMAELGGSRAGVDAAKWQYYPTPSVITERSANQTTQKTGVNSLAGSTGSTTFRLQQPVWSGGRLDSAVRVSELKKTSAERSVGEARMNVALRTMETWQNLLTAYGRKQAALHTQEKLRSLAEVMARRVAQQVSPSVEAELSRSRSLQAQSDLVSAQVALETARFRFEQWVGDLNAVRLSDDKPSALDEGLLQQAMRARPAPLVPQVILPQLQLAIDRYPTLWRIDADIDAAAEDVRLKQAELLPTVYVRLDRQFSDNPNTTLRMADTVAYMGLQYTMGAGLSLRSQVEVALAKLQGMHGDRETARREVKERFESEWREYRSALQRLEQADLVLQSSIGLLVSYERLFVVGRRTWLELLNAVKEVGFAEQARHELQAQIQASHYRLRVYLGELPWQQGR